jgi:hypothetical protein
MASELPIVTRLRSSICENKCKAMLASSGCDCAEAADIITELTEALREARDELYDAAHSNGDPSNEDNMQSDAVVYRKVLAALAKAGGPINE